MNYGLYLSATGVLTNMHRQDVIANNLANAGTTGFKRDLTAFVQRLPESQEDQLDLDTSHELLEKLGGGLFVRPTETDFRPGTLEQSDNDLDLAIQGPGFFAVQVERGGQLVPQLTRDGRLKLDDTGRLVTTIGEHPVLDRGGQPIRLDPSRPVQIDKLGGIRQDGGTVAQLKLVDVADAARLTHRGAGLYDVPAGAMEADQQAAGRILQGWLEQSNVDPIRETVEMMAASRAINTNANLIRYHDSVMDRAVNTLGRVRS